MIVCLCRGVSERHVETVVAKGAATVHEVSRACGAGSDCGACRHLLAALIEDARSAVYAQGERT
jgi:bacterioferritin-associated ferredoxin